MQQFFKSFVPGFRTRIPLRDGLKRSIDWYRAHPEEMQVSEENNASKMKLGSFFVNTSRGENVNEDALVSAADKFGATIIDTWCNEPNINRKLLAVTDIATPHIAGYSYQGKLKGTSMAVRAVARFLGIKELYEFFPNPAGQPSDAVKLNLRDKPQGQIASIIQYNYPIFTDDFMFRMAPENFESLRENYCYRREFFID